MNNETQKNIIDLRNELCATFGKLEIGEITAKQANVLIREAKSKLRNIQIEINENKRFLEANTFSHQ